MCDCGAGIAKIILCTFNFLCFLLSLLLLGIGLWLLFDKNSFVSLTNIVNDEQLKQYTSPEVLNQAAYILIAIGAILFVISFLGYCGACLESRWLLTTYGSLLIIILILEAVALGLAIAYKSEVENHTHTVLKSSLTKYYATPDKADAVTLMWDHVMRQMSCCGVDNYKDFNEASKWMNGVQKTSVPIACCKLQENTINFVPVDSSCPAFPNSSNSNLDSGCHQAIMNWIKKHINLIIGTILALGLLELAGIFLAFCLCRSIWHACMNIVICMDEC